jgi:sensor histidine kinase regulating citrate/malate metabolism
MSYASTSYLLVFLLLLQAFVLCLMFIKYFVVSSQAWSSSLLPLTMNVIAIGNVVLSFLIFKKLIQAEYQDQLAQEQTRRLESMQELVSDIRGQRHDFISHLQTVYGLLQLNKPESAQEYLTEVVREVRVSAQLVKLDQPEVGALIQAKATQATTRNINLNLAIQSRLSALPIRPFHLNRVLGNLLDNAFDAVMTLEPAERFVRLDISEDDKNFTFSVLNAGPEIEEKTRQAVFKQGFSTKDPGRGLGLAISREIVEQYGGTIQVSSPPTVFTVKIPRPEAKV